MKTFLPFVLAMTILPAAPSFAQQKFEQDRVQTSGGELLITFIGHGTLMVQYGSAVFHIDPYSRLADYASLPRADCVLITHDHPDHLDMAALRAVRKDSTTVIVAECCRGKVDGATVMKNGEGRSFRGVTIEAVPAYNIVHKRENGEFYHPKGRGNGYVLTFGKTRIYVAGDTENTPEMKALKGIDYAFLPMNLPYTMTPGMVADAARAFRPKVLYPYHLGETDPNGLVDLLKDCPDIEIRIRRMK